MEEARPLPPFRCEEIEKSKLHHEWKSWKGSLERYFEANEINDQFKKRAKLLYLGGPQLDKIFRNIPDAEKVPIVAIRRQYYDVAITALDNYFQPPRQDILERRRLRQMKQLPGERFSHYMVRLRQQLTLCGFDKFSKKTREVLTELMLADVIVEGCQSNELRRRMLLKDRTLHEIEEIGCSLEGVDSQILDLAPKATVTTSQSTENVFEVNTKPSGRTVNTSGKRPYYQPQILQRHNQKTNLTCFNCGKQGHISSSATCPAKGKQCRKCKRLGHFEHKCKIYVKKEVDNSPATKRIRMIEDPEPVDDEVENKTFYAFFCGNRSNVLQFKVGGVALDMLVDSGTEANLITEEAWEQLKRAKVNVTHSSKAADRTFLPYASNVPLVVRGRFTAEISIGAETAVSEFYVVEKGQKCLLGDSTAKKLGVLKIGVAVNHLEEAKPFAHIKDVEVHIHMDPTAKPVAQPLRRLPIAVEVEVNQKIDQMLKRDIIEVKTGPTTWISPLVVVAKANGGIRTCIDLRRVNLAVLRERHSMPVIEKILARLGDGIIWSKLDIEESFLQVLVAEGSRDVLTFITDKGLFRFKRLPFGLITAPEIFQKVIDEILCGCEGTHWYLDDIFVVGKTVTEHDMRLEKVMSRLKKRGVQLNWNKCLLRAAEIDFLGHKITPSGIAPCTAKVEAVLAFRRPANDSELRSFLGLANYLNKYVPNLATLDEPLRQLTRKGVQFTWGSSQEKAFELIKKAMADVRKLGFYNVQDKTAVIADASPTGLGAILIQKDLHGKERVISFASKALTNTEKRYCQTEKEALALVWSVEKFQFYLLGKRFELITDCKALLYLFTPHSRPCLRIERWVLRLQSFDYEVVHVSGDKNVADALSRLPCITPKPFDPAEELAVQHIVTNAVPRAVTWKEVEEASRNDGEIEEILQKMRQDSFDMLPLPYRLVSSELCFVGDVLMRGDRIVIPAALRQRVIETAHDGHAGMRMMKCFLRSSVWWPKIDTDVEAYVKKCRGCTLVSSPDPPEPMLRRELPAGPWEDIAVDYLGPLPEGQHLLVAVDCYSRYLEVVEMGNTDSKCTIEELQKMFSRYGVPALIKADNGPQFTSDDFKDFCVEYGIRLVSTIPYWPQMNGEIERQNRTILKRLKIAQELGKCWKKELSNFLLVYHATNHSTTGKAPSVLMLGRRLNSRLPRIPTHVEIDEDVRDYDRLQKEKGKEYSDRVRRARPNDIQVGDRVVAKRMRKNNKLDTNFAPEEYEVLKRSGSDVQLRSTVSGNKFRRNVTHLKRSAESYENSSRDRSEPVVPEADEVPGESQPMNELQKHRTGNLQDAPSKRQRVQPLKYSDYIPY